MVDFLRPSSDVAVGGWTNESGGTTLFSSLDETTQGDSDFVRSGLNPSNDTFEVHLSDPSAALADGTLKFAVGKELNNATQIDVTVALMQGTTQIASWAYSNVAFGLTLKTETLTGPQIAAITNWNDLRLRVTASSGGAALDLNFVTMAASYTGGPVLDSRVTHSRTSDATMYGSDGLLRKAPHNLIVPSNDFNHVNWLKGAGTSVGAQDATGPDGVPNSAWTVTISTNPGLYIAFVQSPLAITSSVWLRAKSGTQDVKLDYGGWYAETKTLTTTWQRFDITHTDGNMLYFTIQLASGSATIEIYGAQIELNPSASEYIATVATQVYGPRFDYNPSTLAARGLLLEEQRTNLCLRSSEIGGAPWLFYWDGAGSVSIASSGTAPDGTSTSSRLTVSRVAGTESAERYQNFTGTVAAYTGSIWCKAFAVGDVGKTIGIGLHNGAAVVGVTTVTLTADWVRYSVTATMSTSVNCALQFGYFGGDGAGTGAVDLYVWGAQVELGAFATSHIPTAGTSVTRAADSAEMTGTNFSDWYNQSEGTFLLELVPEGLKGSQENILNVNDGTTSEQHLLYTSGGFVWVSMFDGGATQHNDASGTAAVGATIKHAWAFKFNDCNQATNGNVLVTDTSATIPTVDRLWFGPNSGSADPSCGWYRRFRFYNTRKSNVELFTITS